MRSAVELDAAHPHRLSWGAIFGGAFVALGVWTLLYALGLAIGLSAIEPGETGAVRGAQIGTGLWAAIAPLIALFAGGIVAGRTAGLMDRTGAAMHGAVLWGLTTVAGLFLMTTLLASLFGGAAQMTGQGLWAAFFALLLGLVSAMLGASLGLTRRQRWAARGHRATMAPPVPPPVTTSRIEQPTEYTTREHEVYP